MMFKGSEGQKEISLKFTLKITIEDVQLELLFVDQ